MNDTPIDLIMNTCKILQISFLKMDISLERDGNAIGSLFQQIINDMKNSSPLWEDFMAKASKLHACLRATIQAIAAYLDAFQKIADAATNSRGATKEIGTALTRVCLRHKAVETRMKSFTTAIMDCLIIPLQDKLEDWKRQAAVLDKDHAKEYKRCRTELKKRSSDTLRLQKKARKGQTETIQSLVETSMHDINQKRAELEEVERKSLRAAMVEERTRYCTFVNLLQPVVKEECEVMYELGHLQEAMDSIAIVTKDPTLLPQSSEELILESKTSISLYPESPGGSHGCSNSLGSRKSSVCSISSMNSSGSSGSPGHQYQRSLSQLISPALRLKPGESSDSGFCSSSALTSQTSTSSTNPTHAVSTWPPHSQDAAAAADRPHTISTAYEKGHQRPALTVYTFQSPEVNSEPQKSPANIICRPPLPIRCSSLERPLSSTGARNTNVQTPRQCPSPLPAHITKEKLSLFERLEHKQITNNNVAPSSIRVDGIYNRKNEEIYKAVGLADKDADQIYEDSIQELNNLIGELDSFQKEHELKSQNQSHTNHILDKDFDAFDKISMASSNIGSIGYSIQSNNSNESKLTFNEMDQMKYYNENSSGFESNESEIIHCDNNFNDTETYLKENSEIVVLRRKGSTTDLNGLVDANALGEPQQRLSSFKSDGSRDELKLSQSNLRQDGISISNLASCDTEKEFKICLDERLRAKPTVTPRPASLSGCVSRITRRSSVNTTKPPPPVRRSSSVTPSPLGGSNNSPNISQQNSMNASSESLPPPPAYLLDSSGRTSPGKVCETVKALTELRHMPASPGVIRRAQALAQAQLSNQSPTPPQQYSQNSYSTQKSDHTIPNSNFHYTPPPQPSSTHSSKPSEIYQHSSHRSVNTSQSGIYAQPKVSKVSSFRNPSPVGAAKQQQNSNLMAQLNARIAPNNNQLPSFGKESSGQYSTTSNYSTSYEKSNNTRSKVKVGFLENLNAKLAEQRLSGKAFAVRNLINSKALPRSDNKSHIPVPSEPDPRICHESLMDQIKRGATLKRNKSINDRSAPKIH
ncbi:Protein MTSS 1 [Pseudolycoriella hygida]|uniref:Protein MTSS 1 n=1 Tax=Pseudolycoriella hygida TaxID=35572 RepID=A0A9Q0S2Q8_9DIPT|nr:Protein MTSS 1 [Pseudolycoriella hygida]